MLKLLSSDAQIVLTVLQGHPEHFEVLVRRYVKDLHAVAYAYSRNFADAEDIAQEAFLRAYESLPQLRDPGRFRHWLLTITRNLAHEQWRKQRRAQIPVHTPVPEATAPSLQVEEEASLLRQHLAQLDDQHREVLYLHYFAERSTREIAAMLQVNRETVKKRLERARGVLGSSMAKDLSAELPPKKTRQAVSAVMAAVLGAEVVSASMARASVSMGTGALALKAASVVLAAVLGAGILLLFGRDTSEATPAAPVVQTAQREVSPESPSAAFPDQEAKTVSTPELTTATAASTSPAREPAEPKQPGATLENFVRDSADHEWKLDKDALQKPVTMEFEQILLSEIFGFMSDQWEIRLFLDGKLEMEPHRDQVDGMVDRFAVKATLGEALTQLCEPLGLKWSLEPGFIYISTPQRLGKPSIPGDPQRLQLYDLEEKLDTEVQLEFENIHISEILAFATEQYKINIPFDYGIVAPAPAQQDAFPPETPSAPGTFPGAPGVKGAVPGTANTPRPSAPPTPPKKEPLVQYVQLNKIQMQDALRALLLPLDLAYKVTPSGVYVSTPQRLQSFSPRLAKLQPPSPLLQQALLKPIVLSGKSPTMLGLLKDLRQQSGLSIRLVPGIADALPHLDNFNVNGTPLETALASLQFVSGIPLALSEDALIVGGKRTRDLELNLTPLD